MSHILLYTHERIYLINNKNFIFFKVLENFFYVYWAWFLLYSFTYFCFSSQTNTFSFNFPQVQALKAPSAHHRYSNQITNSVCCLPIFGIRHIHYRAYCDQSDRLCGLVVRVSGYRYRGLGFDSRRYQIF